MPENIKKKQEQSFRYHTKKTQEEHWIDTNFISFHDTQANVNITLMKSYFLFFFNYYLKREMYIGLPRS